MWLLHLVSTARAAFPEDVDLVAMNDFDGEVVFDPQVLRDAYSQLVLELGTVVANKVATPAASLGANGFSVELGTQFALTEAHWRAGAVSPWARASLDETAEPYRVVPTVTVRKGLPLSTEVGATFGWISGSSTGLFGVHGRVSVLDGYRPLPDVALKVGYSGYVGNNQLDLGALDLGISVGTTILVGRYDRVNSGKISPFASLSTVRVTANPTIDPDLERSIGAVRYSRPVFDSTDVIESPQTYALVGFGVQFEAGVTHLSLAATWAPKTIPTISTGLGFTY